jgi:aspartate racemase
VKTIGVLGGVGPQATMDFEMRLHRVAQQLIPPSGNRGYPPTVVYYHRSSAFGATESGTPELPLRPHPDLIEAAAKIGGLADFLVITSNLTHLFSAEIERVAGCEVLSMIDATLAEISRRGWATVGVLGFGEPLVYTQPLGSVGLATETIAGELQTSLDGAILKLMEGRDDEDSARTAGEAVGELRARGVDGIVLGCTEITLLLGDRAGASDLVNPLQLLAEVAVNHALM